METNNSTRRELHLLGGAHVLEEKRGWTDINGRKNAQVADLLRRCTTRGRVMVQGIALFCGAPFVFLCGRAHSLTWVILALTGWGLFKGLYDANMFASVFDVVRPQVRGATAGMMNMMGWLGGGAAPVVTGYVALHHGAGLAISLASLAYIGAGILLVIALVGFVPRDAARAQEAANS